MLPIPEERLQQLLIKYLGNTLTPAERQELDDCAAEHPELRQLIARLDDNDQMMLDMLSIEDDPASVKIIRMPFWQRYRWRPAAAIVGTVLVLTGSAIIARRYRGSVPAEQQTAQAPQTALTNAGRPPGSNRALLILDDGARILLDTIHPGKLRVPDGSYPLRTDTGLSYASYLPVSRDLPGSMTTIYHTLITPGAGQFFVILPDGTKIWLNNASTLRYPAAFTAETREVTLSGEAYFEVAKNARPFRVDLKNDVQIQVLGTSFDVMAYADDKTTRTTLITGSVKLSSATRQQLLKPNQQLVIQPGREWPAPTESDPDEFTAWKDGYFQFNSTSVPIAMQQLARWYGTAIETQGPARNDFLTALLKRDNNLDSIFKKINLTARFNGKKYIVTK